MDGLYLLLMFLAMMFLAMAVNYILVILPSVIMAGYKLYKKIDKNEAEKEYDELKAVAFKHTDEEDVFGACMCLVELEWALRFHKMFPRK